MAARDPAGGDGQGRGAAAWMLLDWAASAFSTVQITLLVAYAERVVFKDAAWGVPAGTVWAWTLAAAMLAAAVLTPWLAAWADRTRGHQAALAGGVATGAGALAALAVVPPTARLAVAACIVLAAVGFDVAATFTGSLLARIASGRGADRLSARGFAAGYAGGALALVAALAVAQGHARLGLTAVGGLQGAFLVAGAWWLAFSLPALVARYSTGGGNAGAAHAATSARELLDFARSLARPADGGPPLGAVLGGAVLVMGAVQTAIEQFSTVALEEFRLDAAGLVRLVLLVQAVALPGALLVGLLSARAGRGAATTACIGGWMAVLVLAWFVRTVPQLHALAVLLALVLGGVQSVIRATVADLAPPGRAGATFGLVQVGTKLAAFAASLAFGAVYAAAGNPRTALLVLLAQLGAGWWLFRRGQAMPGTSRIE